MSVCQCHTGSFASCDYLGGCGSRGGCCSSTPAGTCLTCPVIRPESAARDPHRPPVCDGDRGLLDRWLGDINRLVAEIETPEPAIVDRRQHERFGVAYFEGGIRHTFSRGIRPSDPLAALGGVAPIDSRNSQPSVTGSRDRALPVNTNRIDLTAPARQPNLTRDKSGAPNQQHLVPQVRVSRNTRPVTATFNSRRIIQNVHDRDYVRDDHGNLVMVPITDDDGHLSAATILDGWVRDIRSRQFPDHRLPGTTVTDLTRWLRARLEQVCDHYPQITDLAADLRALCGALRAAAGESEPRPEPCTGVACPRCDLRTLMTCPDDDYRAQCGNCGKLLTVDEYAEAVTDQGAQQAGTRPPEEVHTLLRRV